MTLLVALLFGSIEVSAAGCSGFDVAEVQRIVEIELRAAPPMQSPLRARLRCEQSDAELSVDDPLTNKTLVRRVSLAKVASRARPRVFALAIAELVSASWSELLLTPRAESPALPVVAPEVKAQVIELVPPKPLGSLRLEAMVVTRWLVGFGAAQVGGGARVLWVPRARWGLLADLTVEHAEVSSALGVLRAQTVGALVAAAAEFEPTAWSRLVAGAGARFGVGRISGVPSDEQLTRGATVAGAWGGPALAVQAAVLVGSFVVALGLEGGWALVHLRGTVDGGRGLGLDGPWATASLSVGWRR